MVVAAKMIGGNDEGMDLIDVRSFLLLSYYSKRAYRFRINDWWRRMNKIIIIGCSAAGLSALENLRKYDKQSEVLVLSKEGAPYSKSAASLHIETETTIQRVGYMRPRSILQDITHRSNRKL